MAYTPVSHRLHFVTGSTSLAYDSRREIDHLVARLLTGDAAAMLSPLLTASLFLGDRCHLSRLPQPRWSGPTMPPFAAWALCPSRASASIALASLPCV